jgi:hypothetical protein
MTTLADKNNNPGNLRETGIPWSGAAGQNGGFTTFESAEHGVRAASKNLYTSQEKHGNSTLGEIITRHAPPSENDTPAYIAKVSNDVGIGPNDVLPNLRNDSQLTGEIIKSMTQMEGGTTGPDGVFTDEVIAEGVRGSHHDGMKIAKKETDFDANKFGGLDEEGYSVDDDQGFTLKETNNPQEKFKRKYANVEGMVSPNWLSSVDSPAYRWTLYIVTNEIWNDPNLLANDDAQMNSGQAIIIAQQGTTTGFSLDNFACMSVVTPGQRHGNTTPGLIQFDLFETLGFTFLDKALKAGISLGKPSNLHSQNYILKLEFLGRDFTTGASTKFPGVFFYPVKLNQIRSSTGPEGTRYNIVAWSMLKHAQTETVTETDVTAKNVTTVQDFATALEKAYNQGQKDALNKSDFGKAQKPPKQIKIIFDPGTNLKSNPADITAKLNNFNLAVQSWGSTKDAADANAVSSSPHDESVRDVTIERETSLVMTIAQLIQKNCPAFATWSDEAMAQGITPYIVVDPIIKYSPLVKGTMGGNPGMNRNKLSGRQEHLYANVEPVLITLVIKLGLSSATADRSLEEHTKKLADPEFQKRKINSIVIEKAYTHMYSGTNTEVLNYGIDVEQLYVIVNKPSAGMHQYGKGSSGEPQFGVSELPKSATTGTSPYLEDIPYVGQSVYNDLVHGGRTTTDSATDSQLNELSIDSRSSLAHHSAELAKRGHDAYDMNLDIKGDPYWMGNMQAVIAGGKLKTPDYSKRDAMISFVQFNPNVDKLLTEQVKGEIDIISSGIYKLTAIESRFQGGKFTQTLKGYKDVTTNTLLVINKLIELSGEQ